MTAKNNVRSGAGSLYGNPMSLHADSVFLRLRSMASKSRFAIFFQIAETANAT